MATLSYLLTVLLAYLLGSIPTGFLVAKAKGIDIRRQGSGNIGATNVFRILGKPAGAFVLLADALKGFLACSIVPGVACQVLGTRLDPNGSLLEWLRIAGGLTSILGHNYTMWLRFKGGKGVAASAGVLLALVPWALLAVSVVWVSALLTTRYVSLASITAALALPWMVWLLEVRLAERQSGTMIAVALGMSALAIYKHRSNVQRLLAGTEHRVHWKKQPEKREV